MTENEFTLQDRLTKIKSTIEKYGEAKFFIAYSGGKDSVVLSNLVDMALPSNQIPRVYADTGIELNLIRKFVESNSLCDDRIKIIKPTNSIRGVLERDGYPVKSKAHSEFLARYQKSGKIKSVRAYLGEEPGKNWSPQKSCPQILKYQFTNEFTLNVSDKCCVNLKEKPVEKWAKENNRPISIVGVMASEGGRRVTAKCIVFDGKGNLNKFQPLAPLSKAWEDWFINEYDIDICEIYKPPYNFDRTGCKGCPFNPHLQRELDTLEKYFPAERKQCELIWKPVYDEYRRLNYRLKGDNHERIPNQPNI